MNVLAFVACCALALPWLAALSFAIDRASDGGAP